MKPEDFKKIIRNIVQEEVKKQLPSLITQVLAEKLVGDNTKTIIHEPPTQRPITKQAAPPIPQKREIKKFYSNPMVNQILNETQIKNVRDYEEPSYGGYEEPQKLSNSAAKLHINQPKHIAQLEEEVNYSELNESYAPPVPVVANITPVNEEQEKVLGKINRDFRGLMKAVNQKKASGMGGFGGSVSMGGGGFNFDAE